MHEAAAICNSLPVRAFSEGLIEIERWGLIEREKGGFGFKSRLRERAREGESILIERETPQGQRALCEGGGLGLHSVISR